MADKTQIELFKRIYAERLAAGTWRSDISNKPLPKEDEDFWVWSFSHIVEKSVAPSYKLNPDNIVLLTHAEHTFFEHFKERDKKKVMYLLWKRKWDALFEKKEQLKQKYFAERFKINP